MGRKYIKVYIIMCERRFSGEFNATFIEGIYEDELDRDEEFRRLEAQEDARFFYSKTYKIMEGKS